MKNWFQNLLSKFNLYRYSAVEVDVRNATALTLRTGTVAPTYWRLGGGLSYGGGVPPALATEPVKANFCDGAAWADAVLV